LAAISSGLIGGLVFVLFEYISLDIAGNALGASKAIFGDFLGSLLPQKHDFTPDDLNIILPSSSRYGSIPWKQSASFCRGLPASTLRV
jgi:hypothetical protein